MATVAVKEVSVAPGVGLVDMLSGPGGSAPGSPRMGIWP